MTGIPYGKIATLVFFVLVIRVWFRFGPRIPVTFIGMWIVMYFTHPSVPGLRFPLQLFVCFLAIALLLVERVKSTPWR
jgi:hypothetical protein